METKLKVKKNKNWLSKERAQKAPENNELQISPFVKSMTEGVQIPVGLDYKKEYSDYLSEKYK